MSDTAVSEPVWDKPFSKADVTAWKTKYGAGNIYAIDIKKDVYVIRGLGRAEFQELVGRDFRDESEMEEAVIATGLLYPTLTTLEVRSKEAGVVSNILDYITRASNIDAARENNMEPVEMPAKLTDCPEAFAEQIKALIEAKTITAEDIAGWFARNKNVYMNIIEGKLFIFKSILRKEYEKFKLGIKEGASTQFASEEELVKLAILYPLPGTFQPKSDAYLHGTVSILSQLVYKASAFNVATNVTQL